MRRQGISTFRYRWNFSLESNIWCYDDGVLISLLWAWLLFFRKALPGEITLQAKFKVLIKGWSSTKVVFFFVYHHSISYSTLKFICKDTCFSFACVEYYPQKFQLCERPNIFSWERETPNLLGIKSMLFGRVWETLSHDKACCSSMMKKSSRKWQT